MGVDLKTVERIAELSKLEFNSQEKEAIQKDLNKILGFIETLNEVDTEGVEPLIYVNEEGTPLREDQIHDDYGQKEALKNAPDKDSDFIKVPKVLKK